MTDSIDSPETRDASAAVQEAEDRFIETWGEISSLWGVNRSIGRIHALLYLSSQPLAAEEIQDRLRISHGNVSISVRDLLAWGVIRKVYLPGERKTRYEAEQDPWTWFHTCIQERRRREVMPVLEALRQAAHSADPASLEEGEARRRMGEIREKAERFASFADEFVRLIDLFLSVGSGRMGKIFRAAAKLAGRSAARD